MPNKKLVLLVALILTATTLAAGAEKNATLYFFYGKGCPYCEREMTFLDQMEAKYPELETKRYETWYNESNHDFFLKFSKRHSFTPTGVPVTFMGGNVFDGFGAETGTKIESKIQECIKTGCGGPGGIHGNVTTSPLRPVCVHLFVRGGCPQCEKVIPYVETITRLYGVEFVKYDVNYEGNVTLFEHFQKSYHMQYAGYPIAFIGKSYLIGGKAVLENLEGEIIRCSEEGCTCPAEVKGITPQIPQPGETTLDESFTVNLPILGKVDASKMSLPLFTMTVGLLDGFNPCAMWVLTFLLALLVYTGSRKKMFLVGGIFILTSGVMYFTFMAAWLNLFLYVGYLKFLQIIVGLLAAIAGLINIKDFFAFGRGISLTIPESMKPKLLGKMRWLVQEGELLTSVVGAIVLAVTVNFVELLCTSGFPAIYTRILTLHNLPKMTYYFYLAFYQLFYMLDDSIIFAIAVYTMSMAKLTKKQGEWLKLIGGVLMLALGLLLVFRPEALMFSH